jgi:hypothetical protein
MVCQLFLGIARSLNCEFEKGLEYFRKSLGLGLKASNPIMIVFAKGLMSTFNYIFYGKTDLACQSSQESLQMALESEDIYLKGMAYSSCGMACYCKGLFEEAENSLSLALPLCKKTALLGWETWGTGFWGHASGFAFLSRLPCRYWVGMFFLADNLINHQQDEKY